jgi:hypothetical protein
MAFLPLQGLTHKAFADGKNVETPVRLALPHDQINTGVLNDRQKCTGAKPSVSQ